MDVGADREPSGGGVNCSAHRTGERQSATAEPGRKGKRSKTMFRNFLLRYAARLRYPKLLALALGLFIADLIIPDFIPFVDEILLGLISLLLAGLKKRKADRKD